MSLFDGGGSNVIVTFLVYSVLIGGMYFFMLRPQQKKKKQEEDLRNNLSIGDEIVTIGGIVGKIINIKKNSDILTIETGTEKIKIKRWAIANKVGVEFNK
ncbi:MAG: preprotein translocase subunit YajC [Candidatus Paraimprobicoccus trichonymphae]|uniref:Preprotein translocase subunit YajC n=1 Tax=Candidatus Paraimprobicoccus trichonymphae TaxID=3033793 RepID=A0AA48L1P1_9FIRM|nr:MAG: preprotein translocase subunit YajC [Candidatus Paraimprobicoccus trichonymphae]